MSSIGVLDRTGVLRPLVEQSESGVEEPAEVVDVGRPADLGPGTPQVDVLVLGPRECTSAGLRRLARWHSASPASVVVAFLPAEGAPSSAELKAAGVRVLVRREPTLARVTGAVDRAFEALDHLAADAARLERPGAGPDDDVPAEQPAAEAASEVAPEPAPPAEEEPAAADDAPPPSTLITIASATGGCGKTFYATNLAALVALGGLRVLLVDLDLQFGEVAAALRVRHPYSVYDGLYDAQGNPLPADSLVEHLDELVAHHPLGFDVLTAPREPALADYVGARDASRVLDAVQDRYDVVIVDTPPSLNEVVLTALDRSDVVAVMATLDVPSLKNLTVFLDTLRRLRIDDSALRLVMNKVEPDVGIDMAQAQDAFEKRFVAGIPQSRAVSRSINAGTVVIRHEPRDEVARHLWRSAAAVLPEDVARRLPPPPQRTSLLARLTAALRRGPARTVPPGGPPTGDAAPARTDGGPA